jgi:hypothetical protein
MAFLYAISGESEFQESAFQRNRDRVCAIVSTQLGKNVPDLTFHGVFGN